MPFAEQQRHAVRQIRKRRVPYLSCHPQAGGQGCTGILLDKPEFLNAVAADEYGPRRDEITDALDAIERQRGELAALWATPGELTVTEWQEARRTLAENERMLRREFAELPPPVIDVDIAGAREAWPEMTLDEQREFLWLFIEQVTVYRARPGHPRVFDFRTYHDHVALVAT